VGFSTENPPHNQKTKISPIKGIAESKFVITVAPQKDIWPQGRTYPINAAPIINNKIITPIIQTTFNLYEP